MSLNFLLPSNDWNFQVKKNEKSKEVYGVVEVVSPEKLKIMRIYMLSISDLILIYDQKYLTLGTE